MTAVGQHHGHTLVWGVPVAAVDGHGTDATALIALAFAEQANGFTFGHKGNAETLRFFGEHLDHQARGAWAAAGRTADFIVVGLIAQHRAEAVLGQWQAHVLQTTERAQRACGFDVGGVLVHAATRAQIVGQWC